LQRRDDGLLHVATTRRRIVETTTHGRRGGS
jgi:hypothetical protein